jgi:hypothetical protein
MEIVFTDAEVDGGTPRDRFDLLLAVIANLEIRVGQRLLYTEPEFPVVELRAQLGAWLATPLAGRPNFEYDSVESDVPDLVWIRRQRSGAWRIGAVDQEYEEKAEFGDEEIVVAIDKYIALVDAWVLKHLKIDAGQMLGA